MNYKIKKINIIFTSLFFILISLINIKSSIASGTPGCSSTTLPTSLTDSNCDNSCIALPNNIATNILVAFDPVYQALDKQFDMISAEAQRDVSTLRGITNVTITDSSGKFPITDMITDANGDLCTGNGTSTGCTFINPGGANNNDCKHCKKNYSSGTVNGCNVVAKDIKFNISDIVSYDLNPQTNPITIGKTDTALHKINFNYLGIPFYTVIALVGGPSDPTKDPGNLNPPDPKTADRICVQVPFSIDGLMFFSDANKALGFQANTPGIIWYTLGCRYTQVTYQPQTLSTGDRHGSKQ